MAAKSSPEDEVAALDRILTRLAMTPEDQLEAVLARLVPAIIPQMNTPHASTRKKVMDVLNHVNKRVKDRKQIQLPLEKLVDLFSSPDSSPIVKNFALVYTQMALDRATCEKQFEVMDRLMVDVAKRPAPQQDILLRCVVQGLGHLGSTNMSVAAEEGFRQKYKFLENEADLELFLRFTLDYLKIPAPAVGRHSVALHPGYMSRNPSLMSSAGLGGTDIHSANLPVSANSLGMRPTGPYGHNAVLSLAQIRKLLGSEKPPEAQALAHQKQGILQFLTLAEIEPSQCYLHCLQASADSADAVSSLGEFLLKKRIGLEGPKPAVDLESKQIIHQLMDCFSGGRRSRAAERSGLVPITLKQKILSAFCKSVQAANCLDESYEIISICLDGPISIQQAGMQYAVWTLKHCEEQLLQSKAEDFLTMFWEMIDISIKRGSQEAGTLALRGFAYQALAHLGERIPSVLQQDLEIPERLFEVLAIEAPGVRASLQQSLSALSVAYSGVQGHARNEIRQLLLGGIKSPSEGVRYCAVQWAIRIFPPSDFSARYICILASADHKTEVREAALKGLRVETESSAASSLDSPKALRADLPSTGNIAVFLHQLHPSISRPADPGEQIILPPKAFLQLLKFIEVCKRHNMPGQADESPAEKKIQKMHRALLEHALVREGTSELYAEAFQGLLRSSAGDRPSFASDYIAKLTFFREFLSNIRAEVRLYASKLVGVISTALAEDAVCKLLQELVSMFKPDPSGAHLKTESQAGALTAVGFIIAANATSGRIPVEVVKETELAVASHIGGKDTELAVTAAESLGISGLSAALVIDLVDQEPPASEIDTASNSISETLTGPVKEMAQLCESKELKYAVRAITALGYWAAQAEGKGVTLETYVKLLLSLHTRKEDQVQFSAGEALCFAHGGLKLSANEILFGSFKSLSAEMKAQSEGESFQQATNGDVDMDRSATEKTPQHARQSLIVDTILTKLIYSTKTATRSAACIWLVSLLNYTQPSQALLTRIEEIQDAFSALLGDSDELIQEIASRGVSAVYRLCNKRQQKAFMSRLVSSLSGGARKRRAIDVTGETRVFEEGQIGEAPGGGKLSTYKELCSLATDMGQPDLLYKFMDLANHANALNSSRGAAFGIASIAKLAGEQMEPHIAALVPKLYRYQYDPNPKIRDGMTMIWKVLLADPRKAVDEHYQAIMGELLKEMGGKLWRNREAACNALADLIQGRPWSDVEANFEKLWTMAFRALDDVKESVRVAALTLANSMRSLTLRLADKSLTSPAQSSAAISAALPILIKQATSSSVGSVQSLALTVIAKLVSSAGSDQIRPHLPDLASSMLESLSSMENPEINYVEQHIGSLGISSEKLENMRVSASKSSPMADTLDLCARYTDAPTLEKLMPKLVSLVRRGLGLNTRVGTARFITNLTLRLGSDIKPFSSVLIKNLFAAAQNENSGAVRKAYATTLSELARYAPESRINTLTTEIAELYTTGDHRGRFLAGLQAKQLVKNASEAFTAHALTVLPVAYIACSDNDSLVAGQWEEVWQEGIGSEAAGLRLYMKEIVALAIAGLNAQQWQRKKCAAESIRRLCLSKSEALQSHGPAFQNELLQKLPGAMWDGKESLLQAVAALCTALPAEVDGPPILEKLLAALKSSSASYRSSAVAALATALEALPGDHYQMVFEPLRNALQYNLKAKDKAVGESSEGESKSLPLAEVVAALSAAWRHTTGATCLQFAKAHATAVAPLLATGLPWATRSTALTSIKEWIYHLAEVHATCTSQVTFSTSEYVEAVLPGILEAVGEPQISQVRSQALLAIGGILTATEGGAFLSKSDARKIQESLDSLLAIENNTAVKIQANAIKTQLSEIERNR